MLIDLGLEDSGRKIRWAVLFRTYLVLFYYQLSRIWDIPYYKDPNIWLFSIISYW